MGLWGLNRLRQGLQRVYVGVYRLCIALDISFALQGLYVLGSLTRICA